MIIREKNSLSKTNVDKHVKNYKYYKQKLIIIFWPTFCINMELCGPGNANIKIVLFWKKEILSP